MSDTLRPNTLLITEDDPLLTFRTADGAGT